MTITINKITEQMIVKYTMNLVNFFTSCKNINDKSTESIIVHINTNQYSVTILSTTVRGLLSICTFLLALYHRAAGSKLI